MADEKLKKDISEIKKEVKDNSNDLKKMRTTMHEMSGRQSALGLLLNTSEKMAEDVGEIRSDLKYHIKRTDMLEDIVTPIHKIWLWARYSMLGLTFIATILGILALFKII